MIPELPLHLAGKLRPNDPLPSYKEWAAKHGTPWVVQFPKKGATPAKRRFFPSAEDAVNEVVAWSKDRKPEAGLGKRIVEEVAYCLSILPPGVSLTDACRFYNANHSGSKVTVCEVATTYLKHLKGSADYRAEMKRTVEHFALYFGSEYFPQTKEQAAKKEPKVLNPETGMRFADLTKGRFIAYIKEPDSYWLRYGRKRAVSVLITQARDLEVVRMNPLDGWKFEDAPKSTPHFLRLWEVEAILNHALRHRPELVAPFALQFFAGIRTEELGRAEERAGKKIVKRPLWWSDLKIGESITIPVEVSKTNDRRVIDYWPPALTHWMKKAGEGDTPIATYAELDDAKSTLIRKMNEDREARGLPIVDFRQNDFRRTYATHSVPVFGGEKTKERMGHQEHSKVLKKNYDGLTDLPAGTAYFESKPEPLIDLQPHQPIAA